MTKTLIVLEKEWLEIRLQRALLLTTILMPPGVTALALAVYYAAGAFPSAAGTNMPPGVRVDPALAGLPPGELAQALIGKQFSIMFMLLPVFIPSVIASYAVVGEKRERTLEPLLAAPIDTWELLAGKSLAALIPALVMTGVCAVAFAIGTVALASSPRVAEAVITTGWAVFLLLDVPLLALLGIALIVIVSSRVNDPRSAQQISAVLVVPVILLVLGNLSGVLLLSPLVATVGAALLLAIDLVTFRVAARLFDREAILVRWR